MNSGIWEGCVALADMKSRASKAVKGFIGNGNDLVHESLAKVV